MAKSPEDLDALYRALRSLLVEFELPSRGAALEARSTSNEAFDLWSRVPDQRQGPGVFFAGIRRQKSSVGFYFLPVYTEPSVAPTLPSCLRKRLKGKSCFQLESLDGGVLDHLREALNKGLEDYRRRGWA